MSELLDFYRHQAEENLSHIPWVAELQAKSWHELVSHGFPKRSDEDWKYTPIEELLQRRLPNFVVDNVSQPLPHFAGYSLPTSQVTFYDEKILYNGKILEKQTLEKPLSPTQVLILPLCEALASHEELIKPYFDKLLVHEHGFHSLNTTLFNTGLFIYLPAGTRLDDPILISHYQDNEQSLQTRHLIILEEHAEATILEHYLGAGNHCYFTNTITEIYIGKHAKLNHYKVQCESKAAYHVGHISTEQAEGSQFDSHSINLGGKIVRSDVTIKFKEEKAKCLLNGIYVPTSGQHIDHHTTIHHLVPRCTSQQDYKGILGKRSRAVFNGKVIVAKQAEGTQANQSNKNILLSPESEVDTKPQLEIFSDDISCSHGATVGQLDEEALFYFTARGIEPNEAKRYLIHAFVTTNLDIIPHPTLASWINALIDEQLEQCIEYSN